MDEIFNSDEVINWIAFGPDGEGCLRLCFAVEPERLREACGRIGAYFAREDRG